MTQNDAYSLKMEGISKKQKIINNFLRQTDFKVRMADKETTTKLFELNLGAQGKELLQ
jgi:hypothetical protein